MKRKLLSASLWGLLTLSLFYSCRTDSVATEQSQQVTEKIAAFERFEKQNNIIQLTANSNQGTIKYVSYAQPFAEVIYNFLENHPDYAEKLYKEVGDIRLDVSSQTIGELSKTVIFPVIDGNGNVVSLWRGVINENRDYVKFYHLNNNSEYINSVKKVFQNYYNQKKGKLATMAIAPTKGISPIAIKAKEPKVTTIEEVVITVPKRPKTDSGLDPFPKDPDMGTGGGDGNGNSGDGMSGGPGAHGGSNGGNGSPPAGDINIDQLKKYPCAYAIAKELPSLNNDIAKFLNNVFGNNKKINVTFLTDDTMPPNLDGDTYGSGSITNQTLDMKITLNGNMLNTASKEYILATMYHEVTHAYLAYQRLVLGKEGFERAYPEVECYDVTNSKGEVTQKFTFITKQSHPRFTNFVPSLEGAISNYNPNLSKDIVNALARTGIFSDLTNEEIKLNQNERDTSTGNSKGTKCNNK